MNKLIAVTIGDLDGIGIKLLIKEWKNLKVNNFILFTNYRLFNEKNLINNRNINIINTENELNNFNKEKFNIFNIKCKNKNANSFNSIKESYKYTKKGLFIGILTLPVDKNKLNKTSKNKFIDHTTFFTKLENIKISNMIFMHNFKFFVPLTIHIELKNVYKHFKNKIYTSNKIINIRECIIKDFKIKNPKFVIAGINPHAGENGVISNDENKYIKPVIKYLKNKKILIDGPISGDGLVNKINLKKYDVFLFPFHDQALIPFKIISNYEGVNFTSNLNIIRVSPSHGTARDIINSNLATSGGIINCFKAIKFIYKNRNKN